MLIFHNFFPSSFLKKGWGYCSDIVSTQLPFFAFCFFSVLLFLIFHMGIYTDIYIYIYCWTETFLYVECRINGMSRNVKNPLHSNSYFDSILSISSSPSVSFSLSRQQPFFISFQFITSLNIIEVKWWTRRRKEMMKLFCIKSHKAHFPCFRVETKAELRKKSRDCSLEYITK